MTHPAKRHAFCMAAVLAISASIASLSRTETQAAWNIGDPIVTYWAGPGYDTAFPLTDAAAKRMVDVGMNLVWAGSAAELNVAQRHGLRALYVDRSILLPASLDDPAQRARLDALIDSICHNPALYAYHIIDEPGATLFADLARIVDYLRQRDPAHMAYIDLFPNYASDAAYGTKGYGAYLDTFVRTVKPSLLSYDHYQFRTETDSSGYLQNLAEVRQRAKAAGIPFMNIVQAACWDRGGVRIPTDHQERYLAYTTLAYGAQGISYYVWCWPGHQGGIVQPDGKPTSIYNVLKTINREFVAIARQCQPLKSLGAYLKGYRSDGLAPGTAQLPSDAPFNISSVPNDATYKDGNPLRGVLFGLFGADAASASGATLALVVNLDYTVGKNYTVTGPGNLSVFNAATGKWTATNSRQATLALPPGGGVLVGLASVVPKTK